jgi:aconitate hydratase
MATRQTLGLTGDDTFTIEGRGQPPAASGRGSGSDPPDGSTFSFTALCRIDTANEVEYFKNGGILHYVLRKLAA